jgi:hypothetical protein
MRSVRISSGSRSIAAVLKHTKSEGTGMLWEDDILIALKWDTTGRDNCVERAVARV